MKTLTTPPPPVTSTAKPDHTAPCWSRRLATLAVAFFGTLLTAAAAGTWDFAVQSRRPLATDTNAWQVVGRTASWVPERTALVICDMWDRHWCTGATHRVAEMAPRMNETVRAARARGVLIIHCPSDTLEAYEHTPQRQLARQAPQFTLPVPLKGWCSLDHTKEPELPIDDSDGGCDDLPKCISGKVWKGEIATLEIAPNDAITDSAEAFYLMKQRGITNVLVMGVHLNMCVLGRPFSIRQMVGQGQNVVLVRDLTDTMYNSRSRPFVSHFAGTALMVEHVEKYWCPTTTSAALIGGEAFRFKGSELPGTAKP